MMNSDLTVGVWDVNPDLNELVFRGQSFKVRPRTMELLVYMARRPGQVLSLEELLDGVWKGVVVSDSSVYHAISELRQLFETAGTDDYIKTIPKRGYQLTATVSTGAVTSNTGTNSNAATMPQAGGGKFQKYPFLVGTVGLFVIVALFISRHSAFSLLDEAVDSEIAIAVMAFSDLSPAGDQAYFADGVSEAILNSLHRVDGLQVPGRSSSFYFKGRNESSETIGTMLGVDYILDGSVSKDGDRLRIWAQLTDVDTRHQLWSQSYDREFADVFAVQDDIAASVADAVGISLGVDAWSGYAGMTRNVRAFDAFLQGQQLSPRDAASPERVQEAISHLERAISIDPAFGIGWMTLAFFNSGVELGVFSGDREAARKRADHALARARELIPDSPMVLEYQALMAAAEGRWLDASTFYDEAHQPVTARHVATYADFLIRVGRISDAVDYLQHVRTEHPLDKEVAGMLAMAYGSAGTLQSALIEAQRSLDLDPIPGGTGTQAGFLLVVLGSREPALIEQWWGPPPEDGTAVSPDNINAWGKAYLGQPDKAREILRREAPRLGRTQPVPLASWANYYGEPALALESFRQLPPGGQVVLAFHFWLPLYKDMRQLPGFRDLVRDLGLVEYWRESGQWGDFCRPLGDEDFVCE